MAAHGIRLRLVGSRQRVPKKAGAGAANMEEKHPTIPEWKELYDAAWRFKQAEPWSSMWDTDLFGVKDPVTEKIGYCCVMGKAGVHFGLAVYLGREGLEGYLKAQSGEISPSSHDFLYLQKCLMASFEDRSLLEKADISVVKELGLKFRGHNAWPLFRSYRPGYFPWYLTAEEGRYLTLCLAQVVGVSVRFRDDPKILIPPDKNSYLVRVPIKSRSGLSWKDEWLTPQPLKKPRIIVKPIDEEKLEEIKAMSIRSQGVWEADFFYFPQPVAERDDQRPCFPYVSLCADRESGLVLNSYLVDPAKFISEFPKRFLEFAASRKSLPEEILVKNEETLRLLRPIANKLGFRVRKVRKLKALEDAQASMFEMLAGGNLDT
ncbi:hypothetical protein E3J62_00345 [candidate division TA06 bacterium]|uniref:GNAT family N-acetyltransferase n=1 Tax=candidate division TA06 bacterium TaxID=2250710 RepID=A0A523UZ98_UNCT6|nr:MAG: hypothetical protein E3J62_00345 [candidate division TA06 bacterium]